MPIEINELNIRVNLDSSGGNQNSDAPSNGGDAEAEQALIEKVVEQVLNILKERAER